ncbi:MAG: shikimate dehydrogenase [Actinomycetota bacterium]
MSHLAAVIGWPVNRSVSPAIHNAAFAELELDWSFAPVAIRPDALEEGMALLETLGVEAASVTMPHKERIMSRCASLTERARALGAVNTLTRTPEGWEGHNTDADGFIAFLAEADLQPEKVLILGAGGAAKAVARGLAEEGVEVVVAARRQDAAEEIADAGMISTAAWGKRVACDMVVQATPVRDASLPASYMAFPKGRVAVDLNYGPETAFLKAASDAGSPAFDGLGMLIHQAALAFHRWTGQEAPLSVMRQAAELALPPQN